MNVVLPPSEIRVIVEKLAAYVVKNGPSFEDKILEKERHNPRFSFLYPNDPYHPYYQRRLQEYKDAGPDAVDEKLASSKVMVQSRGEPTVPQPASPMRRAPPPEPPLLDFLVTVPPISALDYDVIKLTAQYVARNGRQFLLNLAQREARNSQFDFLKTNHSLHPAFLSLVEQYSRVLLPPKSLLEKLDLYAKARFQVLERILQRVEYTRYVEEEQMRAEEQAERERAAYSAIDWHDFAVVETIDFGVQDRGADLPRPLQHSAIVNMSIVQRRELWDGNTVPGMNGSVAFAGTLAGEQEEEMEVDEPSAPAHSGAAALALETPAKRPALHTQARSDPAAAGPAADTMTETGVRIRQNYIPRAHAQAPLATGEVIETCPLCSQPIPKSQIKEHIRIEALDPKWREQRERHLAKHRETNLATSGTEISQNLESMNRVRTELAGLPEAQVSRLMSEANQTAAQHTVIWDGRAESVSTATREAMQKSKPQIQAEMAALQQAGANAGAGGGASRRKK